jgi:hypothetical protein
LSAWPTASDWAGRQQRTPRSHPGPGKSCRRRTRPRGPRWPAAPGSPEEREIPPSARRGQSPSLNTRIFPGTPPAAAAISPPSAGSGCVCPVDDAEKSFVPGEDPSRCDRDTRRLLVACPRVAGRPGLLHQPDGGGRYRDRHSIHAGNPATATRSSLANLLRTDLHAHRPLPCAPSWPVAGAGPRPARRRLGTASARPASSAPTCAGTTRAPGPPRPHRPRPRI